MVPPELVPSDISKHSPNLIGELIWKWIWTLKSLPKDLIWEDIFPKTTDKWIKTCLTYLTMGEMKKLQSYIWMSFHF